MIQRRRRTEGLGRTHKALSTDWTLRVSQAVASQLLVSQCLLLQGKEVAVASLNQQAVGHSHSHLVVASISTHLAILVTNLPLLATQSNPLDTPLSRHLDNTLPNRHHLQATTAVVKMFHPLGTGLASPNMVKSPRFLLVTDQAVTVDLSPMVAQPLVSHCQKNRLEQRRKERGGITANLGIIRGQT